MATNPHTHIGVLAALALALTITPGHAPAHHTTLRLDADELSLIGFAGKPQDSTKPKLTAYFTRESYRPGDAAQLVITDAAPDVFLQIHHAGTEDIATVPHDVMLGAPVAPSTYVGAVHGTRTVSVPVGDWPSGVYFAELTSGDRIGYATFVLAPKHLGEHRIAVVMPTQTWQAYNFRDDNGDGTPDTWYAGWHTNKALLIRPFLDRGVPPHWKQYDAPFVRWIVHTHPNVDFISDAELRAVRDGKVLAAAYTLIVFSGHHEYVTQHEYDVVTQYRDLGGNLMFLSANNFFWKITLNDDVMTRVGQWRDLGRPEAGLIGVQYRANDRGGHRGAWVITRAGERMLFAGTPVEQFGSGGIEIDATAASSPKNIQVLAQIPNLYGPGFTGQMSYYTTPLGAKVFAAGAFTLAGSVWDPDIEPIVERLWEQMSTR